MKIDVNQLTAEAVRGLIEKQREEVANRLGKTFCVMTGFGLAREEEEIKKIVTQIFKLEAKLGNVSENYKEEKQELKKAKLALKQEKEKSVEKLNQYD